MIYPCPIKIDCPGTDFPIENYSAEEPERGIRCRVRVIVRTLPTLGGSPGGQCESECALDQSGNIISPGIGGIPATPISIVTDLPTFQVGTPVAISLTASGAPAGTVYTFSISSGTLPSGLSMDGFGNITGTPTVKQAFSFTVLATCSGCSPATRTYSSSVVGAAGTEYGSPSVYYKCEELDGNLIDSVAGNNLFLSAGTPLSTSGKIGMAARLIGWETGLVSSVFDINHRDFTVRFWFKADAPSANDIIRTNQFQIGLAWVPTCPTCSDFQTGIASLYFNMPVTNAIDFIGVPGTTIIGTSVNLPIDGQWHRIICSKYTDSGKTFFVIRIDAENNSVANSLNHYNAVADSPALSGPFFFPSNGSPVPTVRDLDEVAFWNGFPMLKEDVDNASLGDFFQGVDTMADWNNGNGKTYPLA